MVAIIAVLAAVLLPAIGSAREKAKRTVCLNNLKQIAIAFNVYATDWNDTIPLGHKDTGPENARNLFLPGTPRSVWPLGRIYYAKVLGEKTTYLSLRASERHGSGLQLG